MKSVTTNKALFIKLGRGGIWEKDCIEKGLLRLGYRESNFEACKDSDWKKVENDYLEEGKSKIAASGYVTQIKYFFEEPVDTLWITFFNNKLWWSKAEEKVVLEKDGTKIRKCISGWSDKDTNGNVLYMENISGKLLKTQGFRGTICTVEEQEYLLNKINARESKQVKETQGKYNSLKDCISNLIKELTWQDFEVLIDLIFTQAGWQRVSSVGKTAKTLDLDLKAPVTGEKCLVQIKSSSNVTELNSYLDTFESMDQYDKFYYICHSFKGKLPESLNSRVKLMLVDEVSELAIDSGLSKWVIAKVS
ncbi:MAG: hypothetical protein H6625_08670 [Bdellovibrionaceae bacterium]|nr:hypothetical protein [Pseudobdellovibrionaceae bacterium]MCB9092920.1 hypothetical protein [Halobacteriovoraceae bacterium]